MRWFLACAVILLSCSSPGASNGGRDVRPVNSGQAAEMFAEGILGITRIVAAEYIRPISPPELVIAALTGLYEAAQIPVPATLADDVKKAAADGRLLEIISRTSESLGDNERLRGHEAILASCRSIVRTLDPHSALVSGEELRRANGFDQQHGIGVDLMENPGVGPLVIKTVLPGGSAQKAGLRPGDEILELDDKDVRGMTSDQVLVNFRKNLLKVNLESLPLSSDGLQPFTVQLTLRRPETKKSWKATLECRTFKAETVLGVMRQDNNSWDYWIDRQRKLAHVRIASLGSDTADELADVLQGLQSAGMRGLILDLRWCPGGYLNQAAEAASLFLKEGTIATVKTRGGGEKSYLSAGERQFRLLATPLIVLVNGETSGGAELIAAALQDHKRAAIAGQRTLGKASVQTPVDIGVPGMGLKLTSGTFLRPSGKNLHRFPDSRSTDDWGVRPDDKLEFRVSSDLSQQLRDWWQQQTLRPGASRERLPLDDPAEDPQRQAALRALLGHVK